MLRTCDLVHHQLTRKKKKKKKKFFFSHKSPDQNICRHFLSSSSLLHINLAMPKPEATRFCPYSRPVPSPPPISSPNPFTFLYALSVHSINKMDVDNIVPAEATDVDDVIPADMIEVDDWE